MDETPLLPNCSSPFILDEDVDHVVVPTIVERGSSSNSQLVRELSSPSIEEQSLPILYSVPCVSSSPKQITVLPPDVSSDTIQPSQDIVPTYCLGHGKHEKTKSVLLKEYVTYTPLSSQDPSHSPLLSAPRSSGTTYPIADNLSSHRFLQHIVFS